MTALNESPASLEQPAPPAAGTPGGGLLLRVLVPMIIGGLCLVESFHLASRGQAPSGEFGLFWAGLFAGVLPVTGTLIRKNLTSTQRALLVVGLALYTTVPKLLRNVAAPLYSDEFAHWRQANTLLTTGKIDQEPLIRALPAFPGLHTLTAALSQVSGVSVWTSAVVIIVSCHVLSLLGVYVLLREAAGDRVAGFGAALYTTNSSWLFFDVQYAYETLAIPLALWSLTFAVRAVRKDSGSRAGSVIVSAALAFATAATHHLSSIVLILFVLGHALVVTRRSKFDTGESVRTAWLTVASTVGATMLWLLPHLSLLVAYLGPSLTRSVSQFQSMVDKLTGHAAPSASQSRVAKHTLFAGTTLPLYEVLAGLAVPAVLFAVVAISFVRRRRGDKAVAVAGNRSIASLLAAVTVLYFASLPFLLTAGGSEGARRSWAWSSIGLSLVAARLALPILDRADWRTTRRRAVKLLLVVALVVIYIGNVAVGQNEAYRFPGPYTEGSDTLSLDAENHAVADWMAGHVGHGNWVVTNRYLGLTVGSIGQQVVGAPSAGFAAWDLTFKTTPPSAYLLQELTGSKFRYLIVDRRMATTKSAQGIWYTVDEPTPAGGTVPAPALTRFDCLPWTSAVYASSNVTVYRLDFDVYDATATANATKDCT